jgi:hypothetical protein
MGNIYSAQDVANVIAKVEELATVNAELEELLRRGSNDEKLVEEKRELERSVRKFRGVVSDAEATVSGEPEIDADLISLRADFYNLVIRYKKRKIDLETIIRRYTNGDSD